MADKIQGMLEKGAISPAPPTGRGFVSNVFLVPKKDRGQRPVINLKRLNKYVHTEHFKMEGIHVLKDLLQAGDFMVKVDLKDAYFTVPMHEEDRDFLKFTYENKTYRFNCLPFGLACAPWVFTKILRPVAAQLRQMGIRLIVYIDDILIMAEDPQTARKHVHALLFLLENLDFIISHQKCILEPTQILDFLGFTVSSTELELRLPSEKIRKIRADTQKIIKSTQVEARKLSKLLGKLSAATRAIPLAPLFYCNLQMALGQSLDRSGQSYAEHLHVTQPMKEELELEWWVAHLSAWNGKTMVAHRP